jgi:FKBP-type peptidyl-prolyl cis-trans isomerase
MRKVTVFLCLFFAVTFVYANGIQDDYSNADEKTRVSYAFGMVIGTNFDLKSMGIDFDYNAFTEGLKNVAEGEQTMFTNQEAMEIVETALYKATERTAEANKKMETDFLSVNGRRSEVTVTESGLQYEIVDDEGGEKPLAGSVVRVNYTGTFIDGTLFDKSTEKDGALIPLELVIPGWSEGLKLMSPGSIYIFYIPSKLAYGNEGIQGIIPPFSTLIFHVELLEIINEENDDD